jgi:spermidine synthase
LALEAQAQRPCDVLVGGLGLGYTAAAALEYPHVQRVVVVELLAPVIAWHHHRLVPMADRLIDDPRCWIVEDDFFDQVGACPSPGRQQYDVILLDIDHSPESLLHDRHAGFYSEMGLQALTGCLRPGGVFGLWSAWRPSGGFLDAMTTTFPSVQTHEVTFFNPHISDNDSNWIVVATLADDPPTRTNAQ